MSNVQPGSVAMKLYELLDHCDGALLEFKSGNFRLGPEQLAELRKLARPEAALIAAAAPDMLAALEMIQAQVSNHALRRHSDDFLDDPATVAAFSAMRAALKKARGERGPQPHEQEGK